MAYSGNEVHDVGNQYKTTNSRVPRKTAIVKDPVLTGNQVKVTGDTKGTKFGVPTAKALKGKTSKMPAVENPSGTRNI